MEEEEEEEVFSTRVPGRQAFLRRETDGLCMQTDGPAGRPGTCVIGTCSVGAGTEKEAGGGRERKRGGGEEEEAWTAQPMQQAFCCRPHVERERMREGGGWRRGGRRRPWRR